jgi:hypothetical protein
MLKTIPSLLSYTSLPEVLITLHNPLTGKSVDRLAQIQQHTPLVEIDEETCKQLGFDLDNCQYKKIKQHGVDELTPVIGPLRVFTNNRFCDCSALVNGKSVALGLSAIQML